MTCKNHTPHTSISYKNQAWKPVELSLPQPSLLSPHNLYKPETRSTKPDPNLPPSITCKKQAWKPVEHNDFKKTLCEMSSNIKYI